jgi:ferritin
MRKFIYVFALFISYAIVSCVSTVDEGTEKAELWQYEFSTLHLYDSTLNVSEVELAKVLNDFNDVIAELGYPGAGYFLWKVQNDTIMQHRYMITGYWPDKEARDSVHNSEAWKSAWDKHSELLKTVRAQSVYRRYELIK